MSEKYECLTKGNYERGKSVDRIFFGFYDCRMSEFISNIVNFYCLKDKNRRRYIK